MSPERSILTGWHDIDDVPVPIRIGTAAAGSGPASSTDYAEIHCRPAAAQGGALTAHGVPSMTGVNPRAMQAAAVLGISIVLIATAFYFGIDSLRGVLTNTVANVTTVTITEDGHFSPSSIRVTAGSMLTIENKNKDPQVLKAKSGAPLFPVQVLFETPYSFTVPVSAAGTYLYVSETLRESETLTITVLASIESTASSTNSTTNGGPVSDAVLPTPSAEPRQSQPPVAEPRQSRPPVAEPIVASVSPGSSQRAAPAPPWVQGAAPTPPWVQGTAPTPPWVQGAAPTPPWVQGTAPTEHGSDVALINLGTDQTQDEPLQGAPLPTNPYTVAAAKSGVNRTMQIASSTKAKLHSGAPLGRQYRPKAVTQTGPELWLLLVPAMFALCIVYRRWFVTS